MGGIDVSWAWSWSTIMCRKVFRNEPSQISQSYEQYKYLMFLKTPVKNSYLLTMLLITLVIIFAATWCGIYLSKSITCPIQKLAEGNPSGRSGQLGL